VWFEYAGRSKSCVKYTFHAVALANRDSGRYLYEAVKDGRGRLAKHCSQAPLVNAWDPLVVIVPPPCVIWLAPATTPKLWRCRKSEVVVIDLVLQTFLSDLIEALELVKIDGITVRIIRR